MTRGSVSVLQEANGMVSVWVGTFPSMESLKEYVEEIYDSDGDSSSEFRQRWELEWYDEDKREVGFNPSGDSDASELARPHSYGESFAEHLRGSARGNSILLLYDHRYHQEGPLRVEPLRFVGCFRYEDTTPREKKPWLDTP